MPRFYFDIREGPRFIPDNEGQEVPDLAAAEREAMAAAASMARDLLPKGRARAVTITVRNGQGERVLTVTVRMEVARGSQQAAVSRAREPPALFGPVREVTVCPR